jgi:cytochrome c oxidase subunit 2
LLVILLSGCGGVQSALAPAGSEAAQVAHLFWVMLAGAGVIWLLVIGTAVYATRFGRDAHNPRVGRWLILGGGVFPVVTLAALLS